MLFWQLPKSSEKPLTLPQQTLLQLAQYRSRGLFLVTNVILWSILVYTSLKYTHKYTRLSNPGIFQEGKCSGSYWLRIHSSPLDPDITCCDPQSPQDFQNDKPRDPCYPAMELSSILISVNGAWIIPLTPLIFNYIAIILGPNPQIPRIRVLVRRGLLYAGIMAYRTVILYTGVGAIERYLHTLVGVPHTHNSCWYAPLRKSGHCPQPFDHSDHLVLFISHYLAVFLFEAFALDIEMPVPATQSLKKLIIYSWMSFLSITILYLFYHTSAHFHTYMENIVGIIIGQVLVMVPLYYLTMDKWRIGRNIFQIRNYLDLTAIRHWKFNPPSTSEMQKS